MKQIFLIILLITSSVISGQRICEHEATFDLDIEREVESYVNERAENTITIPVVFHIVWKTQAQNVSDARVMAQLAALNRDFSKSNLDANNTPSIFTAANPNIQFCLATRDINGNPTTGIVRRQTTKSSFSGITMSQYVNGGSEAWGNPVMSSCPYLNIYVCDLAGSTMGISTSGIVVIDFAYFGTGSGLSSSFNLGRTGTHEVGHWLNLRHIWGNATCGDDLVNDTPRHNAANYGCPSYPHLSTCTGTPIEMTMNYMDYTNDACMYMFSQGQVDRMRASLTSTGSKSGVVNSVGCTAPQFTCSINKFGVMIPQTGKVRCVWKPVNCATSYTIQYSSTSSFTNSLQFVTTSTDTVITPIATTTNTTNTSSFYFQVKSNTPNSNYCNPIRVVTNQNVGVNNLDPSLFTQMPTANVKVDLDETPIVVIYTITGIRLETSDINELPSGMYVIKYVRSNSIESVKIGK